MMCLRQDSVRDHGKFIANFARQNSTIIREIYKSDLCAIKVTKVKHLQIEINAAVRVCFIYEIYLYS